MTKFLSKQAILVVEDNPDLRALTMMVVEELGFSAVSAENGYEGLKVLRGLEDSPCLVILDLMMPVMDGLQFMARVEQDASVPKVPILVVSAVADECPQLPLMVGRLRKPISIADLEKAIGTHCTH